MNTQEYRTVRPDRMRKHSKTGRLVRSPAISDTETPVRPARDAARLLSSRRSSSSAASQHPQSQIVGDRLWAAYLRAISPRIPHFSQQQPVSRVELSSALQELVAMLSNQARYAGAPEVPLMVTSRRLEPLAREVLALSLGKRAMKSRAFLSALQEELTEAANGADSLGVSRLLRVEGERIAVVPR